jgi:hypothetical protein
VAFREYKECSLIVSLLINSYGKPLNNLGSNILGLYKTPNLMILRKEKQVKTQK